MITKEKIAELKKLAEMATPGPWELIIPKDNRSFYRGVPRWTRVTNKGSDVKLLADITRTDPRPDAAFIASANPETILSLIAAYEDAVGVIEYYGTESNWYSHHGLERANQSQTISHIDRVVKADTENVKDEWEAVYVGGRLAREFLKKHEVTK